MLINVILDHPPQTLSTPNTWKPPRRHDPFITASFNPSHHQNIIHLTRLKLSMNLTTHSTINLNNYLPSNLCQFSIELVYKVRSTPIRGYKNQYLANMMMSRKPQIDECVKNKPHLPIIIIIPIQQCLHNQIQSLERVKSLVKNWNILFSKGIGSSSPHPTQTILNWTTQ